MLQNFADAGKALYKVARKYASKVTLTLIKKLQCFDTIICIPFLNFKLSIQLTSSFALLGRQMKIP